MTERIKTLIDNLKHLPGVYLMHDKDDTIIYVGKAKDLYKRVSQYFLKSQSGKVFKMVSNVAYFETIITKNEKEALILEMNLIQKYYPRYNILLKDGGHYPYIALKKKGDIYLTIKRNKKDDNYIYYGPFPNSRSAYEMVDLINKIFPIRKCKNLKKEPCLYYHLHQCLAPCINKINEEKYEQLRSEIISFLNGNNEKEYQDIKNKMLLASEEMNYELAATYKKILDSITHINTKQNVETNDKKDRDIFAYSIKEGYLSLTIFLYRNGMLLGKQNHIVEQFDDLENQVSDLILQFYQRYPLPKEVVVNNNDIIDILKDYLDVDLISVTKGKLYELVVLAKENANNALDEHFLSSRLDDNKIALLEELGKLLHISTPYYIELFDNSHLQGSSPVGAMVTYINGEKVKGLYRKYNLEHEESRDDLASMKEVIYRHLSRNIKENKKMPDLILTDGGQIQVEAASLVIDELNLDINVFGLYKNDKHQTEGLVDKYGQTYKIDNKSLFFLLRRMQDEVHRFAISFHKQKRNKAMTISLLDDIKGLGNKRKEVLKRTYKDVNDLKEASLEELSQLLPIDVATSLFNKLHQ